MMQHFFALQRYNIFFTYANKKRKKFQKKRTASQRCANKKYIKTLKNLIS